MLVAPHIVCDSATTLGPNARDAVVLCGSHCGLYAAHLAAVAGVRAVILNDAGVGREAAGIAGLDYLQTLGVPAAAISHKSARIGDGADALRRGRVSYVNAVAAALHIAPNMPATEAMDRLSAHAERRQYAAADIQECRTRLSSAPTDPLSVILLDSASLVASDDRGQIVITGSHGALLGGRPETALKIDAFAAIFNDADTGMDDAGLGRLAALDARAIAAATVSAWSARIGDSKSSYHDGYISHANRTALGYGARIGMSARDFVDAMQNAARRRDEL